MRVFACFFMCPSIPLSVCRSVRVHARARACVCDSACVCCVTLCKFVCVWESEDQRTRWQQWGKPEREEVMLTSYAPSSLKGIALAGRASVSGDETFHITVPR